MVDCEAIAIGGSAGALSVVTDLLEALPSSFRTPIFLCLHLHPSDEGQMARLLGDRTPLDVVDAIDKMPVRQGCVHVAPANYHLLVERTRTLALSIDPKVSYCRPSIDVLFESAARAYAAGLLALLLSGANEDGAAGVAAVRARGGTVIVQAPSSAQAPVMPRSAIDRGVVSLILEPHDIKQLIVGLQAAGASGAAQGKGP